MSESDAVDALRLPFYSSSHPTGSHGWRNQFDLGNPDLGTIPTNQHGEQHMNSDEIRESFLSYFESKGHLRVASSSLIPIGDPTLLLTTAGMVQFKPYFAGESTPPNKRLTSSQKSFRAVDIDEVGDATHLTLFEMLGNFSIGDYFKEGAVHYALECFTEVMDLPRESFAATVHHSDDETFELWQQGGHPRRADIPVR